MRPLAKDQGSCGVGTIAPESLPSRAVPTPLDVVGVGNALVDLLCPVDDGFLVQHGMIKGAMALVDADRSAALYQAMGPAVAASGGSAANTLAGLASLGARGGFIGRVADDELGHVFAHDITALGIEFPVKPALDGSPTGRCLIVVTPDAERTMSTYLGASNELTADDIDEALVARAAVTYLEGYLVDGATATEAFHKAAAVAHGAGRRVAVTLSDSFCVDRFRDAFRLMVREEADLVFGNADELRSLYETDDLDEALAAAAVSCEVVAVTRGAAGCTIVSAAGRIDVPATPVTHVVDTTGAGDLFAAGFLRGFTLGLPLETCGRLGGVAAAEVIGHLGARPEVPLAALAADLLA